MATGHPDFITTPQQGLYHKLERLFAYNDNILNGESVALIDKTGSFIINKLYMTFSDITNGDDVFITLTVDDAIFTEFGISQYMQSGANVDQSISFKVLGISSDSSIWEVELGLNIIVNSQLIVNVANSQGTTIHSSAEMYYYTQ